MENKVKISATLIGLLMGGISYWFQPYDHLEIFGSFILTFWSAGTFLASLVFALFFKEKSYKMVLFISLGIVLAVLSRIIYDVAFLDNSSHNLAPFEIIICGIITVPSAIAGAYLANLFRKIKK